MLSNNRRGDNAKAKRKGSLSKPSNEDLATNLIYILSDGNLPIRKKNRYGSYKRLTALLQIKRGKYAISKTRIKKY